MESSKNKKKRDDGEEVAQGGIGAGAERTEPAADPALGFFGEGLKQLLHDTFAEKTKQLEERERVVAEREKHVDHVLRQLDAQNKKGVITLRVGQEVYQTTADVLLSVEYTYFHGLLNQEFYTPKDGTYFIPRDGKSFTYVLEYLTYGALLSSVEPPSLAKKLLADCDFYLLPELKEQVTNQREALLEKRRGSGSPCLKLKNGQLDDSGEYWQWHKIKHIDSNHFRVHTQSHTNDTVTIRKDGTYLVMIRTTVANLQNGTYMALQLNGTEVSQSYNCMDSNYTANTQINELFTLKKGDQLRVYQTHNNSASNGGLYNQFSIVLL